MAKPDCPKCERYRAEIETLRSSLPEEAWQRRLVLAEEDATRKGIALGKARDELNQLRIEMQKLVHQVRLLQEKLG